MIKTTRPIPEVSKSINPMAKTVYLDYDSISDRFEYSELTGITYEGEVITRMTRMPEHEAYYPTDDSDCSDYEDREDYNYYLMASETEALLSSPDVGEGVYGMSEIKHYILIKSRKIREYKIDAKNDECVTVSIHSDEFPALFNSESNESTHTKISISIEKAKHNLEKTMKAFEKDIKKALISMCGPKLGKNTSTLLKNIIDKAEAAVIEKIGAAE